MAKSSERYSLISPAPSLSFPCVVWSVCLVVVLVLCFVVYIVSSLGASSSSPLANAQSALALRALRPGSVKNLDWAFSVFCSFCQLQGFSVVTAEVFNAFLSEVAQFQSSDALAKSARSAVCWLADLMSVPRPVNRLTFRLMHAISRCYKVGDFPCLLDADFAKVRLSASSFARSPSSPLCLLNVLFCTGLRPCALHRLSASAWSGSLLFTRNSKGFPNGVSVFVPEALKPVLRFLSARFFNDASWFISSPQGFDELTFCLRSFLANDPKVLPSVSLRSIRSFYATHLFVSGVSSAFLMRQLGHSAWSTTSVYIRLPLGAAPIWRSACSASRSDPLIPEAAFDFDFVHDDPDAFKKWKSAWRKSFLFSSSALASTDDDVLCDDDASDIDCQMPSVPSA